MAKTVLLSIAALHAAYDRIADEVELDDAGGAGCRRDARLIRVAALLAQGQSAAA
jgi:hypothetical protein